MMRRRPTLRQRPVGAAPIAAPWEPTVTVTARKLPPPETLTERQLRGAGCCFCGADLAHAEVTDLGQQRTTVYGARVSWFPRCCATCPGGGA